MLQLEDLFVMQDDLRHWSNLAEMVEYVQGGGFWTPTYLVEFAASKGLKVSPIIQISHFEDDFHYLHDGHHRCVATWLGGRNYLREDEYRLKEWKYDQYLEISHANGWYTPFDPRLHVRTADFADFKRKAKERFLADPVKAEKWVRDHGRCYRRDRTFGVVPELASAISCRLALKT
jgi:hypothetical protein